ncbi:MAG: L-2-hydroxyglutarate oxidase [Alphaproteobacteria bacterium]
METRHTDFLIIGGGIIGLALARELKSRFATKHITIIEKETHVAEHGSGRNSGVLHAGFYYSADSLKAQFCRDGNRFMKEYVTSRNLKMNPCGKVVVAKDEAEWQTVHELKKRGDANGVNVSIISQQQMDAIEPNAKTHKEALHSPDTATVDPIQICNTLAAELKDVGVDILLGHPYAGRVQGNTIRAGNISITAGKIFNCAGLYADRVAKDFGFCSDYTIIPFKGIHLISNATPIVRTLIYPVPNLKNPFLGVHFNLTVDGRVKIGPTAIPAFWRENYKGLSNFKLDELLAIGAWELKLLATNAFNFRSLAWEEIQKYNRNHLLNLVRPMVKQLDDAQFNTWLRPGIRAQLLNKKTLQLVQDFTVEGDAHSVHVLNAVSPGYTSSFAFAKWIVGKYV